MCQPQNPGLYTWRCQWGMAEISQAILMAPTAFAGGQVWEEQPPQPGEVLGFLGCLQGKSKRGAQPGGHVLCTGFSLAPSPGDRFFSLSHTA